jgi:aspartyl-tRNA synthetase
MNAYRTHTCEQLRKEHIGEEVSLSGWVHRKRDHGNLLFLDLRDHYGVTQCVIESDSSVFSALDRVRQESVVSVTGKVTERSVSTINSALPTGDIEIYISQFNVLSEADELPMPVFGDQVYPEETRLRYRFLDLRRSALHNNMMLRSKVMSSVRKSMEKIGFFEHQTPILTSSSPEGARDFLVPSRLNPGRFYALPQAPQIFKQLIMVAGFDRYFQIAPCFRDEDPRADRSPGEFYQLDVEMSFVEQDDVLNAIEPVSHDLFAENSDKAVTPVPFPRLTFEETMLKYGTDKPDLRINIEISDVSDVFARSDFSVFASVVENNGVVRAIPAPGAAARPRSFFDKMNGWAQDEGAPGLGWISFSDGEAKGPIAKRLGDERLHKLKDLAGLKDGDGVFFSSGTEKEAVDLAGRARVQIGEQLDIVDKNRFEMVWIIDYPMYEWDDTEDKLDFSHNPFSMPQGGFETLASENKLDILGYQYDLVCNGIELGSGAIRNHEPETMFKAFELVGYSREEVETKFGGLLRAFHFGAPPHGGIALGLDRIVMLLLDEANIREVIMFPLNQQAQDPLLGAPSEIEDARYKELHLNFKAPKAVKPE